MGCSASKNLTVADMAVTSRELQMHLIASKRLLVKVEAGTTLLTLTMVGGVGTFILSTTKVLKNGICKGAWIFDIRDKLVVKLNGVVRTLPGHGTCWYKLLLDISRKEKEGGNALFLHPSVVVALDAAKSFAAMEEYIGMPLLFVKGHETVQTLNEFVRSIGCGFTNGPHESVMHYSECEGCLTQECLLGAPASAAPGTYYAVDKQLLDSYEPTADVKASLFCAESVYQVMKILLENCTEGVVYDTTLALFSLHESTVDNFKKYLLNLSALASQCQADEIYFTNTKRILRYDEGRLTLVPSFSGESIVLSLCGGEYSSLVAVGGKNFVKTVALVLEVCNDNPFRQPLLRDSAGTIEEDIAERVCRFNAVQLIAALIATYAGCMILFWASEDVGKGYFALLAITFGALLEDEIGLLPDYVNGMVAGSGTFSPWISANSSVLPRNIDRVVTTLLLAATPVFSGRVYRVIGTLSCTLSALILIANLGSHYKIVRNTPYTKPNNVFVSVTLSLEEGIYALVRYALNQNTLAPDWVYIRTSRNGCDGLREVFSVVMAVVEIGIFYAVLGATFIALLPIFVVAMVMACVSNCQEVQLPPAGVAWDHRAFDAEDGGLGWDHWDKGVRVPARFVLVAGSPRMKGDAGIFTNSYGSTYQLSGCDYMGNDMVGAFTRLAGGLVKQHVWLASGTRRLESDLLFAHTVYGCCTSALHLYGPSLNCQEVTLSIVGSQNDYMVGTNGTRRMDGTQREDP